MKNVDDFLRVLRSRHEFVGAVLPQEIDKQSFAQGQLAELEILRDALGRLRHIKGHDQDGRSHRLEFQWAETDRVKACEALLLSGGRNDARIGVAWSRDSCSSRMIFPNERIHFALSGDVGEHQLQAQLSLNGEAFEGTVRDGDKQAPFLSEFYRFAKKGEGVKSSVRWHAELLTPLLHEMDRMALAARVTPGRITKGEAALCAVGTAGAAVVGGLGAVAYAFVCFGLAALG